VAGRDVTEYLQTQLRKAGYIFHTSAEKEIVRQIKEKTSYVAQDPLKEEKDWTGTSSRGEGKSIDYTLPDGKSIKVSWQHSKIFRNLLNSVFRSVLNGFALLRSSLTQNESDLNIRASIRWSWMRFTGRTWTYARACLVALSSQVVPRSQKVLETDCYTKCKDWLSRTCGSRSTHHQSASTRPGQEAVSSQV
jgi:hypothetical protein